jgi:hypothetical protein
LQEQRKVGDRIHRKRRADNGQTPEKDAAASRCEFVSLTALFSICYADEVSLPQRHIFKTARFTP